MIAQLISVREALGLRRQVFFCAAQGFDTHGGQVGTTPLDGTQADLLTELDGALTAFDAAMTELNVADSVTAFTASDFGRTYIPTATAPTTAGGTTTSSSAARCAAASSTASSRRSPMDGPNDAGDGRWIPTTSVDEYAATLARWFGVAASDLPLVLPNLGRFAEPDLGFMG